LKMKGKLTILLLFIWIGLFGQKVPDTNTFSLQDVVNVVNPTTNDLQSCINDAIESYYDPTYYTPPATSLLEFRNYGAPVETTETFTSSGTWTCPTGVSNITAEVWGAGGSGGTGGAFNTTQGGGGGAGGNYIKATYTVTPGNSYSYTVGSGGSSGSDGGYTQWNFDDSKSIHAGGGWAGEDYSAGASAGGVGYSSWSAGLTDLIVNNGGVGANGASSFSGGGGGAAGPDGNGFSASGIYGGDGNGAIAGDGGDGTSYSNTGGSGGSPYGGGGGGGTGTASGGNGYNGYIRITYW